MRKTLKVGLCLIGLILLMGNAIAQRQMENLNRGIVAFYQGGTKVYVSWRLFATDPSGVSFNIYKSVGGATATKLNSSEITTTTDYVDNAVDITKSNAYYVRPVISGSEQPASESYTLAANVSSKQYIPIPLATISGGTYNVGFVYAGDIDGDGDYDYIVKRFLESTTDRGIIVECYLNTGELKWRINMGPNIETGNSSMSAPILVYDFNGDGKAEVLMKTGEGTTFGNGVKIGDTNSDGVTDYNTHVFTDLYQVTKDNCPEFLSLVNGATGAEMTRTNFLSRYAKANWTTLWGDNYGHRMNFIQASVAYLDGVHPSAVFSRGPGGVMDIVAWDLSTGSFSQRWTWTARGKTFATGTSWVDFHQIKCVDVDGDGKDEMSWGSGMLDDNGTVLYTTKLAHGDRFQIGDFNPNRAGLEAYAIQQDNASLLGTVLYDAKTGTILKEWYLSAVGDVARGDVADVNPNVIGMELFSLTSSSLQSCTGAEVSTARPYPDLSVWWDGDLGREFFVGIGSGGYNPAINKWNYTTGSTDRIFTVYNDGGSYAVTVPYAGRAPFIGDILGDWREEIILESSDHSELRIYSTVNPASNRIYTLMHNPAYRIDVTTKGYLCSKYPDYYLGWGMSTPPAPNITLIGGPATLTKHGGGSSSQTITLGTALTSYYYTWANATSATVSGLPSGVTSVLDATAKTVTISGTPTVAGTFTYVITTTGGSPNASVSGTITVNTATTSTFVYQGEDAVINTGVTETKNAGYVGTGYANTDNAIGTYVEFTVTTSSAGSFSTFFRYSSLGDRPADIYVNGTKVISALAFPTTVDWITWSTTVAQNITLLNGVNTIRVTATTAGGCANLDYLQVTGSSTLKSANITDAISAGSDNFIVKIYPNPVTQISSIIIDLPKEAPVSVKIFNMQGEEVRDFLTRKYAIGTHYLKINPEGLSQGIYLCKVTVNGQTKTMKIVVAD